MLDIRFEDSKWDLCGPEEFPEAHLLLSARINGVFFHCEAYAVVTQNVQGDSPIQVAAHDYYEQHLSELRGDAEDPFYTIKIDGFPGDYVLHILPFCT